MILQTFIRVQRTTGYTTCYTPMLVGASICDIWTHPDANFCYQVANTKCWQDRYKNGWSIHQY